MFPAGPRVSIPTATSSSLPSEVSAPPPPEAAIELFGSALPALRAYADLLVDRAIPHGLLGPHEAGVVWERHLFNCAAVLPLVPPGARVGDIGSGAGLPGLVLALTRSDVRVTLVEPLQRRCRFLQRCVDTLELGNVAVLRGRAPDLPGSPRFSVATARAVAPLPRLIRLVAPLLSPGGVLLALKGARARQEMHTALATAEDWTVEALTQPVPGVAPVTILRAAPMQRRGYRRHPR